MREHHSQKRSPSPKRLQSLYWPHSGRRETRVWVKRKIKETSVLTIWACYHSSFKYRSAGSKSIFSPARNLRTAWSIFRGLGQVVNEIVVVNEVSGPFLLQNSCDWVGWVGSFEKRMKKTKKEKIYISLNDF